jgi:IS30 family transposase
MRSNAIHIYAVKKAGFNQSQIAREIGVDKATTPRKLSRNSGGRGYRPKQAHSLAQAPRQSKNNATGIEPKTWLRIESLTRKDFYPEQVSG